MTKPVLFKAILAATLLVTPTLVFAGSKPALKSGMKNGIAFINMPETGSPSVRISNGKSGTTIEFHEGANGWSFNSSGAKTCSAGPASRADSGFFEEFNRPDEMGTFVVNGDTGVFVSAISGGTSATDTVLYAFNIQACAAIAVNIHTSSNETELSVATYTSNWNSTQFAKEREFLSKLMPEYGYVNKTEAEKNPSDPRYAWYWWKHDNSNAGKLKLRAFKGKAGDGSMEAELKDGTVTYTAWFKSGVTVYDSVKNEFRPLYHPNDIYCWPTVIKRWGDYLIIGTNGEGVVFVNLKTETLLRSEDNSDAVVQAISVKGNSVSVNDGEFTVALPK